MLPGSWFAPARPLSHALLLASLLATWSCSRREEAEADRPAAAPSVARAGKTAVERPVGAGAGAVPAPGGARRDSGLGLGEEKGVQSAANHAAGEEDDDDDVDHWKGVQFDVHNFDEVFDYVQTYYIDAAADHKRAWIEAANFALLYLEPSEELVPMAFHQKRVGTPDEEGRLDGRTQPFVCKGATMPEVLLHHVPNEEYLKQRRTIKKRGRLSNEEVMALRERQKARNLAYHEAWKAIPFSRTQFECVMTYVAQRIPVLQTELNKENAARKAKAALQTKQDKTAGKGTEVTAKAGEVGSATDKAAAEKAAKEKAAAGVDSAPVAGRLTSAKGGPGEPGARGDQTVKPGMPRAPAQKAKVEKKLAETSGDAKGAKKDAAKAPVEASVPAPEATKPEVAKPEATAKTEAPVRPNDRVPPKADDKEQPPLDMNRAWLAAASGFLYALDPHSSVINRKQWDKSTAQTQDNSFEGIGAVLTQRDDATIVENPMEGRPAWRAGVRAGDIIHKVDGVDVAGWMLNDVVKLIRGPKSTTVKLTISRESEPEPREVAITREAIDIKNVDGHLLKEHPGVAHVKMSGFIPKSTSDLHDMIDKLARQAPGGQLKGLVLDLRNNSGGLLTKAIEVADMFLPSGRIVSVRSRRRQEEVNEAAPKASDYKFPMVVLVNDSSASASEIVASAIQDNKRGMVLGLRTFGKASVQTLFEPALHQDYYIKLTVARYYAPNGSTIQVVGVTPDVQIAPDVDGKIPVGFREENLNNHLIPIEGVAKSPWQSIIPALNKCVVEIGVADKIAKREPKPQIHPDFQLLRSADYLTCLARHQQAAAR